ncbi:MAG TPA: patatin-like phospholipase family protein [Actinospica sp.]|nr:patatin-like phospholipase family protein [Actinospica sp.]HWG28130.1 patatin-like phospholipase family protein [Actinospica sp.]
MTVATSGRENDRMSQQQSQSEAVQTAFVLGGGGAWGAYEVGMLRALLEAGIEPDIVIGTSVGAINGSAFAADPGLDCVERLEKALTAPKQPWEVASVVFEIARRHRLSRAFADLPIGVDAHLMPTGNTPDDADEGIGRYLRYRDYSQAHDRIQRAYQASAAFLASLHTDGTADDEALVESS